MNTMLLIYYHRCQAEDAEVREKKNVRFKKKMRKEEWNMRF